ncbi:zinc-dependent metalloprotease [Flavobacterium stagni]|uniref:T9SS type A sorting domain-containing protein n=1 Tax=Flavobacterium stagni TaxID=2506421 RepID=A0A4Q1KDA4_9FLAO|nr:zinc-dependent metalloprotease family protein [Flavobacterium stagni]RXR24529.1 T9SS type A sorting domain-containing protein [Flavobacterium stagni]
MKKSLLLSVIFLGLATANAQTGRYWSPAEKRADIERAKGTFRSTFPTQYDLYTLNFNQIKSKLFTVVDQPGATCVITLPNSQGKLEDFIVNEASNFDAELQAQFPEIRAFSGKSTVDPSAYLKLSIAPQGIKTVVFRAGTTSEFMEPFSADGSTYVVYNKSNNGQAMAWKCDVNDEFGGIAAPNNRNTGNVALASNGVLKTMRLAQSCTAEYSNYFGATSAAQVNLVLAAFNATLTRANGCYEKDLGVHLNIVAQSTNVIYYNAATDPYSAAGTGAGGAWNTELQNTLSGNLTGTGTTLAANNAAYDIGHLFGASGGGGNAGCIGCVCTDDTASTTDKNKGSGYTSPGDGVPEGDTYDIDYVVHEVGHQLGANHTFTHANEGSGYNVEVGSGITIMGYAGITNYNAAMHSIDTYHVLSISQIQNNLNTKTCPVSSPLAGVNATPTANAGGNFTIPKSTPFMLIGSGADADGDALTYSWEQVNVDSAGSYTAANSVASPTKAGGPNWISYSPSTSPVRYCPVLPTVFNGGQTTTGTGNIVVEALSSVARTLNFRLTVRDNATYVANTKVAQTGTANATITVDGNKGPLTVTSQNTSGISYTVGSTQTVTWAVNSTDTITGGANVDILITTDNGATWTTLLAATPNDGTADVVMPTTPAVYCRLMVKASNNIFFNVNSTDFSVGYTITTTCATYTNTTPVAIPDGLGANTQGAAVNSVINVPATGNISDVNVSLNVSHTYPNDLVFQLVHPNTTTFVNVWNRACGSNDNFNVTLSDGSPAFTCVANMTGTYAPSSPLSAFNNLAANGNWTLYAADFYNTDTGTLNSWGIEVCTAVVQLNNDTYNLDGFVVYPNPNNGIFNVKFNPASNDINVTVHDIRGREVYNKAYTNNGIFDESLNLGAVEAGVYLVTVKDGSKKEVRKIVIK